MPPRSVAYVNNTADIRHPHAINDGCRAIVQTEAERRRHEAGVKQSMEIRLRWMRGRYFAIFLGLLGQLSKNLLFGAYCYI